MARQIKPISAADARRPWEVLHQIADQANREMVKAFLDAVMTVRNGFNRARFERLLKKYDFERVLEETNWKLVAETELQPKIAATLRDVLESAAAFAPLPVKVEMAWDITNPSTLEWVRAESAQLVTLVSQETKQAIKETILRGIQAGKGTAQMAEEIRDMIGLNARQAAAYEKYAASLAERGIPEARRARLLETYHRRLIKERANLIARTETIKAANEGYRASIRQAVSDDLIDPNVWEMAWVVTKDDRACPRCESMRGMRRPIEGMYDAGQYAGTEGPPGHPQCRCAEVTKRISSASEKAA